MGIQHVSVLVLNALAVQVDILEHKETQLKGTERRVHSLQQQVEILQTELSRSATSHFLAFNLLQPTYTQVTHLMMLTLITSSCVASMHNMQVHDGTEGSTQSIIHTTARMKVSGS